MQHLFNEKKAAQAAALFLFNAGGRLDLLKLMELLYLAERKSYEIYGDPIIGDQPVSIDEGPVLAKSYNLSTGVSGSKPDGWSTWVSPLENGEVRLRDPSCIRSADDLLELSDSDVEILNDVWRAVGHLSRWKIRDHTHEMCPEWQDPKGSIVPIDLSRLLGQLRYSSTQAAALVERLQQQDAIRAAFKH